MTSLRQWFGARMMGGFLPAAIAILACSPMGASVALADAPDSRPPVTQSAATLSLGGLTSNGWPVHIRLARSGKRIVRAVGAIDLPCSKGGSLTFRDTWRNLPVRGGRFRTGYRDSFTEGGETIQVDDSFAGKVNRKRTRVTGTWRNKMVIREADGSVDSCDSGVLRFTASR